MSFEDFYAHMPLSDSKISLAKAVNKIEIVNKR